MKYIVKDTQIIRIEDDKHVADIVAGKITPTAPAYYKVMDELEAAVKESAAENAEEEPETKEAQPENVTPIDSHLEASDPEEAAGEEDEAAPDEPVVVDHSTIVVDPSEPHSKAVDSAAGILYGIYYESVGGKDFNGDDLPEWKEFVSDQSKQKQADAWREVAKQSLQMEETHEADHGPVDFSEDSSSPMPDANPALGDRDPAFIAWLVETNSEEARKRYEGKGIEAYDDLTA